MAWFEARLAGGGPWGGLGHSEAWKVSDAGLESVTGMFSPPSPWASPWLPPRAAVRVYLLVSPGATPGR